MSNIITPNLGLKKPTYQDGRWDKPNNENWDILDDAVNKCGGANTKLTSTLTTDIIEDKQNSLVVVSDDYSVQVFNISVSPVVVVKSFGSLNHVKSIAMEKKVLVWIDDNGFAGYDLNTDTVLTAATGILPGANDIDIATLANNDQCIAIATENGLSVIVGGATASINLEATYASHKKVKKVEIIDDRLFFMSINGSVSNYLVVFGIPTASESKLRYDNTFSVFETRYFSASFPPAWYKLSIGADITHSSFSRTDGIALISENTANYTKGMSCFIDTEFNTGWMMGETVGAWLCNDVTIDRHKPDPSTALTKHGSLFLSPVIAGSELKAVSGFSTANYLEKDNAHFSDTLYAYCWVKGASGWKFKHGIVSASPIDGLSITGTVLKVSGTYPKALLRLTKDTPTAAQLTKIEAEEQPLFHGEQCLIQGTDKNVKSLFEENGVIYAGTTKGTTSFDGLTAKLVHNGDTTAIGSSDTFGGPSGATITIPKEDVCTAIAKLKQKNSALDSKIVLLEESLKPCNASLAGATSNFPNPWPAGNEHPFSGASIEVSNGVTTDKALCSFTIQKDGTYQVNATCLYYYTALTGNGFIYLDVNKNGSRTNKSPFRVTVGMIGNTNILSTLMDFVSGDVITFQSRLALTSINNTKITAVSFSIFKV